MISVKENVLEIKDNLFYLEISIICTEQEGVLRFPDDFEILSIKSNQRKIPLPNNNVFKLQIDEKLKLDIKTPLKALKILNTYIAGIPPLMGEILKLKKPKNLLVTSPALQHGKYIEFPSNEGINYLAWGKAPKYTISVPVRLKTKGKALITEIEVFIPLPPDYYQQISTFKVNTGKITVKTENDTRKGVIKLKRLGGGSHGVIVPSFQIIPKGISLPSRDFGRLNEIPSAYKKRYCRSDDLWAVNHPKIIQEAEKLRQTEIYSTAYVIMNFVRKKIEVKGYSKRRIGAVETLKRKRASNTDRTDLFITLCRSADLPCRIIHGLHFDGKPRSPDHYWADIFTMKYGWVPVDPAFGFLGTQSVQHIVLSIDEHSSNASQYGYDWKARGVPRINFRPERPIITNIQ